MADRPEPCPFCGAHLPEFTKCIDGDPKRHLIKCTECPGRCEFFSSTEEQAVKQWNRRAAPAPGGEVTANLVEALKECMATVEFFHGEDAWDIYRDHSPEMKRWRAAIADAERAKP